MKGTTYNQLQVFQAIVREGSIRGAARKLEMAAPSVSQSLKLLEANIGLTLFHRTTRKIELTEAGRLLHERTMSAMDSLNYALESVQELSDEPSGPLRVTIPRFVYNTYFQKVYADFCRLYPQIQLEVSISDAAIDIAKEGFDLGLRFGSIVDEDMVAKQLTPPMKEALFASPSYIEKNGQPKSLDDLKQHRLIQYRFMTSNKLARLNLVENGQETQVEIPISMIVNDTDLMVDAAKEGLGIGRLVYPALEPHLKDKSLLPILETRWSTYPGIYVYFNRNSQKVKRVRVFIDYLLKHFG
ncbi:LysR family transcriptional regulator [Vibrio sp. SCSIO 43136]|uniref:LysR family transcriptional regulator n=1 Tax=Vibrio sp. SCSIO 43136 TaxID=2819101 RepID=UPI0020760092|nr:LysR family transcriptional regulator [Vibrio sp. SCSIO 43136]USD67009.1 LysR family transcriptional regulator [Vibrio sp. SCSIO 43136]